MSSTPEAPSNEGPPQPGPPAVRRREKFQFRIWQILLVTTLVGLLLAVGRALPYHQDLLWFYIPYFTLVSLYLLLRLPMVLGIVVQDYKDRAAVKRQQLEAAEALRDRHRDNRGQKPADE